MNFSMKWHAFVIAAFAYHSPLNIKLKFLISDKFAVANLLCSDLDDVQVQTGMQLQHWLPNRPLLLHLLQQQQSSEFLHHRDLTEPLVDFVQRAVVVARSDGW